LQDQIACKSVVFEKYPFKTVIILAVDTPSKKLEKLTRKNAIGARIEPGIPHVPGIGITPHKNRISGRSDVLRTP
jgi:hypothetical protein